MITIFLILIILSWLLAYVTKLPIVVDYSNRIFWYFYTQGQTAIESLTTIYLDYFAKPPTIPDATPTLFDIVKTYGTRQITTYYPVGSTTVNAQIGSVPADRVSVIAGLISSTAKFYNLDEIYFAAANFQESCFYEKCINNNLGPNNPNASFATTDWGMCQMSGQFLPNKPGMSGLTQTEMATKALTAEWAIPAMGKFMAGLVENAVADLANADFAKLVKTLNTTKLTDTQWLSTLYYNRGRDGSIGFIKANDLSAIAHPYRVGNWYAQFDAILNNAPESPTSKVYLESWFESHISR